MKIYFLPVASDFISEEEIQDIIKLNSGFLKKLNCQQVNSDRINEVEFLFYFVVTGGTEQQILELQEKRKQKFPGEEVVLLAHATHNSLPAALEVLARFQQDRIKGKIIYLSETSEDFREACQSYQSYQSYIQRFEDNETLFGKRIGLIGQPSDWLVASSPSAEIVKQAVGADIIPIDLDEVKQIFQRIGKNQITEIASVLIKNAAGIREPSLLEIYDNIKIYLAMKKLIYKYKLDAVTIRCFDLVLDLKTTGCFALSRLNDEGIIAGCEGDLNSTIAMMWAQKKYKKIPWMANPAQIDRKDNSLILAHCTVPCSLVLNYNLRSHFESGLGVGIQGEFLKQKVALLRIGGKNLDQIWQVKGKIVETGNAENLCRTQIKVKLDDGYSVQDLLINPLGNHLVVVNSTCCLRRQLSFPIP